MSAPKIKRKKNKRHHHFPGALSAAAATLATPGQNSVPIDVSASLPTPPRAAGSNPLSALLDPETARHTRTLELLQEFHRRERRERPNDYHHGGLLNRLPPAKPTASASTPTATAPKASPQPEPIPKPAPPPSANTPPPGHSTGPTTPAGKARAAQNAFRHGLTAPLGRAMHFLPDENPDEHERLRLQFNEQFVPMTSAELELVAEIVDALWLARRARDLQTRELFMTAPDPHLLSLYLRYETAHTRAHQAAIKTLLTLQKDRRQRNQHREAWNEPVVWGFANRYDLDTFTFPDLREPEETEPLSPSPTAAGSSFRNPAATTINTPAQPTAAPPETAPNHRREEVKPAA